MRKDLVAGILLVMIAGAYYAAATTIQSSTLEDEVGPTGLPTILSALLALIGVGIAARALMIAPAAGPVEKEAEAPWPRALGMLAIGALYIPVSSWLGYAPALALLLLAVTLYEGLKPSWRMFAVAICGAAFFWLLFDVLLGVRQPEGLFF